MARSSGLLLPNVVNRTDSLPHLVLATLRLTGSEPMGFRLPLQSHSHYQNIVKEANRYLGTISTHKFLRSFIAGEIY